MPQTDKTPKLFRRNNFRFYRKITIWVLFFISLIYGSYFFANYEPLQINEVKIAGQKFIAEAEILEVFEKQTTGKYFWLVPKTNILFIPKQKIIDELRQKITIENVYLKRITRNSILIEIVEYEPVAVYCYKTSCYFVNNNGILFVEAPKLYSDGLVTIMGEFWLDQSVTEEDLEQANTEEIKTNNVPENFLGLQYTDQKTFKNLIKIWQLLLNEQIKIVKIETTDFETYTFETGGKTKILVQKRNDPVIIVENLKTVLIQESIHEIQFNNIDYFDLRFEDKVYYKLK